MSNKKVELLFQIRSEPCKINTEKTNKLFKSDKTLNEEEKNAADMFNISALVTVSKIFDEEESFVLNYSYILHVDEEDKLGRSGQIGTIWAENNEQIKLSLKKIFSIFDNLKIHAIQFIAPRDLTDIEIMEKTNKEIDEWLENYLTY